MNRILDLLKRKRKLMLWLLSGFALILMAANMTHSSSLFDDPYSAVLKDNNGHLLSARIAADGQWRFPISAPIPEKYRKALLAFEDKHFYYHPGVDPLAIFRAIVTNVGAGKIVSGGSTLTMQVIRLSRKGKPRVISEKLIELWQAFALELTASKNEILQYYTAHAPYGGNVVGLEAASWRWFGRPPDDLSWAEAATLAILPNAPSMISVQKNRAALLEKRNRLLLRLLQNETIDSLSCSLAMNEPLPAEPVSLPDKAPHYLEFLRKKNGDGLFLSTIDPYLQQQTGAVIQMHYPLLKANEINHMAVIIRDIKNGHVLAYHGNVSIEADAEGNYNDMVQAKRSSGSILKPFLFAAALQDGLIHVSSLLPDVPTWMGGFNPKNFDERYAGAVTAAQALQRSLNVPFVHLLKEYDVSRFHQLLLKLGFASLSKPASHYGLSLILGGGEVTLWDLSSAYAAFGNNLLQEAHNEQYPFNRASVYMTTEVLRQLNRPETESGWHFREDAFSMAWKTGTSFGFRDAWAVGYTPTNVIGVWVGNADGHGRPGLTGIAAAAPLLFDIASLFNNETWFKTPLDELQTLDVCALSGYTPGPFCQSTTQIQALLQTATEVPNCKYDRLIRTDSAQRFRIPGDCQSTDVKMVPWFVLPPLMEYYYRRHHAGYQPMPPVKEGCNGSEAVMDFVYPPADAIIFQPKIYNGSYNAVVFELVHRDPEAILYWHIDNTFLGQTSGFSHQLQMPVLLAGKHRLTVVDKLGNSLSRNFELENQSSKKME